MGSTTTFNPSFPQDIIDKALEEDPERFGAEYMCRWRDDLCSFIDRLLLDAAVDTGVIVRPPIAGVNYTAGCDASGGRNDSFTAAIAHKERDGAIVLDVAFERKAPFNPSEVVGEVVKLMKDYRCINITGDHYAAQWTRWRVLRRRVPNTFNQIATDQPSIWTHCRYSRPAARACSRIPSLFRNSLRLNGGHFRRAESALIPVPAMTIWRIRWR
jgi:hypothetical protein